MQTNDNAKAIIDLAAAGAPVHKLDDGTTAIVVPAGYSIGKIPPHDPALLRINQNVVMHDKDSFVAYVNRYKTEATRIFAEPGFLAGGAAHVTAVIDYHLKGDPKHGVHTAKYAPRYSEQWQRWNAACKSSMAQAQFAEFIEEVRADIHEPAAATLLDIVRMFKASKKTEFDSVVYQPNGDVRLVYDEKTEQKGQSGALPERMKLGIPVYFRGPAFSVPVFVRFKVENSAVKFALKLDRADVIEDEAFSETAKAIGEATVIDVYLGRR